MLFLARDFVYRGISQYQREADLQKQFQSLAAAWRAPTDRDAPDVLFPKQVSDFKLVGHAADVRIPELGIDVPGRRARYESPRSVVDLFLLPITGSECDSLLQHVQQVLEGKAGYRHFGLNQTDIKLYRYSLWTPKEKGVLLWCAGWLLFARTATDGEPDAFLRAYLGINQAR